MCNKRRTNFHPLLSTGRCLNHIVDFLINFTEILQSNGAEKSKLKPTMKDLVALVKPTSSLPSDLHDTPANIVDVAKRLKKS